MMWERDTSGECPDEDEGSATITAESFLNHTITELEESSNYIIRVSAINSAGSAVSYPVTKATQSRGDARLIEPFCFTPNLCI